MAWAQYAALILLVQFGCMSAQSFRGHSVQALRAGNDTASQTRLLQTVTSYLVQFTNHVGSEIYFKIGGGSMPLICRSSGIVANPSWEADGAEYRVTTGGVAIAPLCAPICPAATAPGDVSGSESICDLPEGPCNCLYTSPGCKREELCRYCRSGLQISGPLFGSQAATAGVPDGWVGCVEPSDWSPVYKLDDGKTAEILLSASGASAQRLISDLQPFGHNVFAAEDHEQTMLEFNFGHGIIDYDISLIPRGCDDIPHQGSSWQSNEGWGKADDCFDVPVNQVTTSCPRCYDNLIGPSFNFAATMKCEAGGIDFSCLGPVEGSFGSGGGWPINCGHPDLTCTDTWNEACPQAYFHPRFYPGYGNVGQPTSRCNAGSSLAAEVFAANPIFRPFDGGTDHACRGSNSNDNSNSYYSVVNAANVDTCKHACRAEPACVGIEYSSNRCEVWTRTAGIEATKALDGYLCLSYGPTSGKSFRPIDGGTHQACRGSNSNDNSNSYYSVVSAASVDTCKDACRAEPACVGIEYSSNRCEVWTRTEGIEATKSFDGYLCLSYGTTSRKYFRPIASGMNQACRGSNSNDNSDSYYFVVSAASVDACKDSCRTESACVGIEYKVGRCEVWTRTGGIQATKSLDGYLCLRYS